MQRVQRMLWTVSLGVATVLGGGSMAAEVDLVVKPADGFELKAKLALPEGAEAKPPAYVVVLIHGSGPQGMDLDLTSASKGQNLYFKDLSALLTTAGYGVLRYDKRAFAIREKILADRAYMESQPYKDFMGNPLKYFVDDASAAVDLAKTQLPKAKVVLFGFSQGTYVGIQVAGQREDIAGLALAGFYTGSLESLTSEQVASRATTAFAKLDTNHDGVLDAEELSAGGQIGAAITMQLPALDADRDGSVSRMELVAGNMANLVSKRIIGADYTMQELRYPLVGEVLATYKGKVVFFQGLRDNQTFAHHTRATEIAAKFMWQRGDFKFVYFPELGHVLDAREDLQDMVYRPMHADAKTRVVAELKALFGAK